ncbi:hypothetical protein [Duganella sp. Leaf61]|uniref:hypothetical protein n=1 Tax=Duganella sp. Leaf61 TaxID=1736227 RepID=UPI000A975CB6|nr:hypothetical protein [Duganella sp. Leaf61]
MPTTYIRTLLARSHAATHRTQLLISRCRHGCLPAPESQAPATGAPASSAQAAWYARQQQLFLDWLDGGGMTQESAGTIGNSGIAPLFPAPCTGADEESQFSQVRMRDAVR